MLSDRPVERFQQTVGKVQHRGGVEKEGDEYENKANAVAAKVAAGESAEHAPKDFSETNSGEKQSQGRDPTDPHSTSSHQAQTIVNRLDEAEKKINLALSLSQKGNYQEALKLYEEALKLAPNYSLAWYNQGRILFKLNRLKDALHSNQTALAINNNWGTAQPYHAWNNRGVILARLGRFNEALQSYQQALAIVPGDKLVQNNLTELKAFLSNNPSLRNQSQQAPEPEQGNNLLETLLGALSGAFNENQTGEQAVLDFLISLIPIIGQVADARDFAAYLYRIVFKKQFKDLWNWIGLALTLVGLVPVVGDIAKYLGKSASHGNLPALVKNAEGVWKQVRSLNPELADNIPQLKAALAQNWGNGVQAAKQRWNTALSQLLNWVNGIPDLLFSQQKRQLIEAIQEVSRESDKMLSQAFDVIRQKIDEALDEIGRRINPNGQLVTPEGVQLPSDGVDKGINGPMLSQGSGGGAGRRPNTQSIQIDEKGQIHTARQGARGGIQVSQAEIDELKKFGLTADEVRQLDSGTLSRADQRALEARRQAALQNLNATFDTSTIQLLIKRLTPQGLRRLYEAGGIDGLKVIREIFDLEAKGKISNFDDWLSYILQGNRNAEDLENVIGELREARRLTGEIRGDEVINIGGDAQATRSPSGERPPSYDMTVESKNGQVLRNLDVTTLTEPLTDATQLGAGVGHAIGDKWRMAQGLEKKATVESTIRIELPSAGDKLTLFNGNQRIFGPNGSYTTIDPVTGLPSLRGRTPTGDLIYNADGNLFSDFQRYLERRENADRLRRVNLVDKNTGKPLAIMERDGRGKWTIIRN